MSESDPIRVHARDGRWLVNYGSYIQGYYDTRAEAIKVATAAAFIEQRELTIDPTFERTDTSAATTCSTLRREPCSSMAGACLPSRT